MPRQPERPKRPVRELFAKPRDAEDANRIAREVLGSEVAVNYTDMPKNIGEMGDSGVYAHTPIISVDSPDVLCGLLADPEALGIAANRICNETGAACRVLLDLTPQAGHFEADPMQARLIAVE